MRSNKLTFSHLALIIGPQCTFVFPYLVSFSSIPATFPLSINAKTLSLCRTQTINGDYHVIHKVSWEMKIGSNIPTKIQTIEALTKMSLHGTTVTAYGSDMGGLSVTK